MVMFCTESSVVMFYCVLGSFHCSYMLFMCSLSVFLRENRITY